MMLFRNATMDDLDAIHHLAVNAGIGITTLSKDKATLEKRLQWACDSFKKDIKKPKDEYYFFVLVDPKTQEIVGTSAIESCLGTRLPFYTYKLSTRSRFSKNLNIRTDYQVLSLVNDKHRCSEICTLFLHPDYRKNNNGQLLSRARFLFMAHYPKRFADVVIADMRGFSDENGISPFWEAVGKHFFHMSFSKADELTLVTDKQLIADLMPRNPIYVCLLPKSAQAVIGKPHPSTVPALRILEQEGFRYHQYIDIFDAGPTMEVKLPDIRTNRLSQQLTISSISDTVTSQPYLVSHTHPQFKATIAEVMINPELKTCVISKETARLLNCSIKDTLCVSPLTVNDDAHFKE